MKHKQHSNKAIEEKKIQNIKKKPKLKSLLYYQLLLM